MRMMLKDICDIIRRKAREKAKNWDFKTEEEFRTYIYEHELPFVEMHQKKWWTKENGKRVYIWPNGEKY